MENFNPIQQEHIETHESIEKINKLTSQFLEKKFQRSGWANIQYEDERKKLKYALLNLIKKI